MPCAKVKLKEYLNIVHLVPSAFADCGLFLSSVLDITHILLSSYCGPQDSASYFYRIIICRVIRQNRCVCYEINPLAPCHCMQLTPAKCRRWQMQINYYNNNVYNRDNPNLILSCEPDFGSRSNNLIELARPTKQFATTNEYHIYISLNISFNSLLYRMALVPAHSCSSVNNNSELWRRLWPNRKSYAYSNVIYI